MRPSNRRFRVLAVASTLSVLLVACGGGDDDAEGGAEGEAASEFTLQGTDDLAFEPDSVTTVAGEEVAVTLECGSSVEHTFLIEGQDEVVVECPPGGSETGTFTVDAGEYTFYCDVPGHEEAGMVGTLTAT